MELNKASDKELIEEADRLDPIDWGCVSKLIKKADSEEAKNVLRRIRNTLYHREEYSAGLL